MSPPRCTDTLHPGVQDFYTRVFPLFNCIEKTNRVRRFDAIDVILEIFGNGTRLFYSASYEGCCNKSPCLTILSVFIYPLAYFTPGMGTEQTAFPHGMIHFFEPGHRNGKTQHVRIQIRTGGRVEQA